MNVSQPFHHDLLIDPGCRADAGEERDTGGNPSAGDTTATDGESSGYTNAVRPRWGEMSVRFFTPKTIYAIWLL